MMLRNRFLYPLFTLAILFGACSDDDITTDVSVLTEEVIFVSGERALISGRVLALGEIAVVDHGFQVATNEDFSNPTLTSLGSKDIPGRFIAEILNLETAVTYYCRSYIDLGGEIKTGNTLEFSTISPWLVDFEPKEGSQNFTLTIEGRNLTGDTEVLWNGMTIIPDDIIEETFIEFKIPALDNDPTIDIQVVAEGNTLSLDTPFEYIIGTWNNEGPLNDPAKNINHVFFEEDNNFIYGLGVALGQMNQNVHVVDKNSLTRTTLNFPGIAVEGAFYSETFFGGGSVQRVFPALTSLNLSKSFWKYEDFSFVQLQNVPTELYQAVALRAGDKLYLYGGETDLRLSNNRIYIYDIPSNSWAESTISPISPRNYYPAFHLNGFNYFVTEDGTTHRHNLMEDSWDTVAEFPVTVKQEGIALILNDQAFVGMQDTERRFFVYRPDSNTWRTKKSIPDNTPYNTLGGWVHNERIYVMRTNFSNVSDRQIWSHDPNGF